MAAPKKRLNIELHLSLSATFLSLAALIVSIFQTKIAREQQQKSVLPYLQVRHETVDNTLQVILENKGVGPAFVQDLQITHKQNREKNYNDFVVDEIAIGQRKINQLYDQNLPEPVIREQIAKDSQMILADDWYDASKDEEIVETGTALKEGDQMSIYVWKKKGYEGGPFINHIRRLLIDSTYQIKIVYRDVYDNCWQLIHKQNRNKVVPLTNCAEPVQAQQ